MLKTIFLLLLFFSVTNSFAQKKLTPINQSTLTGISLPTGSKQDSRMLSTAAAKMLLEMESKKVSIAISSPEVLVLPPVAAGGFNADSLVKNLSEKGWAITVIEADKKYAWLQKDSRNLIMYFSMDAKETGLYFAEAASAPVQTGQGTNNGTIQTAPTETNQTQQTTDTVVQTNQTEIVQQPTPPVTNSGFAFTTTNFDDGWISTVQQDWVQVTKANIKVLIHYPNAIADAYNSVLKESDYAAWNTLVAPRYGNLGNFEWKTIQSWQSITFVQADATENATGKKVHIVLFKEHYSNGSGAYLEFVTDTKAAYENEFGAYRQESYGWEKTADMQFRNKFAVGGSDLSGTWTSNFSGMTQYVNAYTGASAGADTHASSQKFVFGANSTYNWDIGVASGFVGNIKFQSAKSNGKFTLPNAWQVHFSDMEGKPKTYDAYFSCVRGGRILWLSDVTYPGYTAFGKKD